MNMNSSHMYFWIYICIWMSSMVCYYLMSSMLCYFMVSSMPLVSQYLVSSMPLVCYCLLSSMVCHYLVSSMPLVPSVTSGWGSPRLQLTLYSLVFCVSLGGSYTVTRPRWGWLTLYPGGKEGPMSGSLWESRQHIARDKCPWSYR